MPVKRSRYVFAGQGHIAGGSRLQSPNIIGFGRTCQIIRAVPRQPSRSTKSSGFVVIKRITRPVADSGDMDRIENEIANHAKVSDHPHIATLYDTFRDDKVVCLQLELAEDGNLLTAINDRKLFKGNNSLVRTALLQLTDALQYCHDRDISHGDLQPQNILCSGGSSQFRLLLCDFGMSTAGSTSDDFSYAPGSQVYTSPERLAEELRLPQYCPKLSDIWSVGIIMIGIICARAPWETASSSSPNFNLYLQNPSHLRSILAISKEIQGILESILSINPMARISLSDLRRDIYGVESFFMSEKDLSQRDRHVQDAVRDYQEPAVASSRGRITSYTFGTSNMPEKLLLRRASGSRCSTSSETSIEFTQVNDIDESTIIYPSPALGVEPLEQHEPQHSMVAFIANTLSNEGSSSDEDGDEMPKTPFSLPVEIEVEVPELSENDGIGASMGMAFLAPPKQIAGRYRTASWSVSECGAKRVQPERPRAVSGIR